jgi:hypothetical protein
VHPLRDPEKGGREGGTRERKGGRGRKGKKEEGKEGREGRGTEGGREERRANQQYKKNK